MDRRLASARGIDRALVLEILAVVGVVLVIAAPLRLAMLDGVPPGLSMDEAAEGVDAVAILRDGQWPVFLPSNNGREPLFAYVAAAVFAALGPGVVSLRLAAGLLGLLTVPATYLCVRELLGRRTAFVAALVLAVSEWHIHLSRLAVRPVSLPLLAALTVFFLWRALRTGKAWAWVSCGLCLGLSFYTYVPARLLPAIVAAAVVWWVLGRDDRALLKGAAGARLRRAGSVLVGVVVVAAIISAPLGLYFWQHPADFVGRAEQVSIANAIRAGADVGQTVIGNVLKTAGMFFVEGDANPRHNLPGKPVFDAPMAALAALGLGVCLKRIRDPACGTILCWNLVMLVPAVLSDSAPHFLRAAGLLPALLVFPSVGLTSLWGWLEAARERRGPLMRRSVAVGLAAVVTVPLAFSLVGSVRDVFYVWPSRVDTRAAFDVAKVAAGDYLASLSPDVLAYVGPLEATDQVMRFLHSDLVVRSFGWTSFPLPPEGRGARYIVVGSDRGVLQSLERCVPSGEVVYAADSGGVPLFSVYEVRPHDVRLPAWADAASGVVLGGWAQWLGYEVAGTPQVGSPLSVTLAWRCLRPPGVDYQVFVHLVGPDGQVWAVKNAEPGEANQPTSTWSEGETVIDRWTVHVPPWAVPGEYSLRLGLIDPATGQRVAISDRQGRPLGTELTGGRFAVSDALIVPPASSIPAARLLSEDFISARGPGVRLCGVTIENGEVTVGDTVAVTLFWQSLGELGGNVDVRLALVDSSGKAMAEWKGKPVGGAYPTNAWKAGRVVRDRWTLSVPASTVPGVYRLEVGLADVATDKPMVVARDGKVTVDIGHVVVKDRQRRMTSPVVGHPVGLQVGDSIRLVGYDVSSNTVRPGDAIELRLYWECLEPVAESYTVFTHLLDGGERIWAQEDGVPGRGTLPTSGWVAGEFIEDEYRLVVSAAAPAGDYVIEVGMYLAASGHRLTVVAEDGRLVGDRILLGNIELETP